MMLKPLQTGQQRAGVLWPWIHVESDAVLPHGVPLLRGAGPPGRQDQPHRHARRGIAGNKKIPRFYKTISIAQILFNGFIIIKGSGELSGCTKKLQEITTNGLFLLGLEIFRK
jgi:hypothetical protein